MGAQVIERRDLLAGGAGLSALAFAPALLAKRPAPAGEVIDLPIGARSTRMSVWSPAKPHAVALFSHGHGSWPDRYEQLAAALNASGVAVLGPVHVDSVRHPDRANFTMQASFAERLADMGATSGYAAKRFAGLPIVAVGHSFGTLTALCLAGGLDYIGRFRDPRVKAVLGFSTPGKVPGLVQPVAYRNVAAPVMIVTGTADLVPGFVTDAADHLFPAQTVPTASYALTLAGGDHVAVAAPAFDRAWPAARLFVDAYGKGDAHAAQVLARWTPAGDDHFVIKAPA